jgi:hypothetical protein
VRTSGRSSVTVFEAGIAIWRGSCTPRANVAPELTLPLHVPERIGDSRRNSLGRRLSADWTGPALPRARAVRAFARPRG